MVGVILLTPGEMENLFPFKKQEEKKEDFIA